MPVSNDHVSAAAPRSSTSREDDQDLIPLVEELFRLKDSLVEHGDVVPDERLSCLATSRYAIPGPAFGRNHDIGMDVRECPIPIVMVQPVV